MKKEKILKMSTKEFVFYTGRKLLSKKWSKEQYERVYSWYMRGRKTLIDNIKDIFK